MKTRALYFTGCLLLALFFMSLNAFGQETHFQLTLFGGGSFLKAERIFVVGGEPFRSNFAKGGKVGVRGGAGFDDHWAAEGAYSYGTNNLRFFDLGREIEEPGVRGAEKRMLVHPKVANYRIGIHSWWHFYHSMAIIPATCQEGSQSGGNFCLLG